MKLLFDDNLSWRLEKLLSDIFPGSKHIRNIPSLSTPASDTEIWDFALKNHFIIVTNDDDFYKLAMARDKCPKIIIIRTGNKKTKDLVDLLSGKKEEITAFYENKEYVLLEIR